LLLLNAFNLVKTKPKSESVKLWLFELPSFVKLNFDTEESDLMLQIHGYPMPYRIALGKEQGRKDFTL
jgi:hypothetical protein